MSKAQEFEDAPVGALARKGKSLYVKMGKVDSTSWWRLTRYSENTWMPGRELAAEGYKLDPTVPKTPHEALDLAWELAHPVKEGQEIPADTMCLQDEGNRITTIITPHNWRPIAPGSVRTLEDPPEPKPDWLDAPAVLARLDGWTRLEPQVFARTVNGEWRWTDDWPTAQWYELRYVTPLYPKENA